MKTFRNAVRHNEFAISAEIYLRPETDAASVRFQADALKDYVDGVLLTDNQYGQLHMSPLAAASILLQMGVDPIVQLASRNRNRIALVSDLLGAGALGVTSLLLVAGERPAPGFEPRPRPVMDLTATDLIRTATTIRNDENLRTMPDFFVGGIVTPVSPGPKWKPKKLREKIEAGAQFTMTHTCMSVKLMRRYMSCLVDEKLTHRTSIIVSVVIMESADDARWLKENRPNVILPPEVVERLEQAADPKQEGIDICAEVIRGLKKIPGIEGVNIMATRDLNSIPRAITAARLLD